LGNGKFSFQDESNTSKDCDQGLVVPFPNEHAARLKPPGNFKEFRRKNDEFGSGVDAIFGIKEQGGSELQAIRFDKTKFTVPQARQWLESHGHKPILFEPASDSKSTREAFHIQGTHWVSVPPSGSCPGSFPAKMKFPGRDLTVCFTRAAAANAKDEDPVQASKHPKKKRVKENEGGPMNAAGMDVFGTLRAIEVRGTKFSKQEANFIEQSTDPNVVCGACRFYLRNSQSEIGQCQVVEGDIPWFATSNLYISALDEARFVYDNVVPEQQN